MDSAQILSEKIRRKIQVWAASVDKPPFSEEQLVVMALAEYGAPMTAKAVYEWICNRFPYYSTLARDFMWNSVMNYRLSLPPSLPPFPAIPAATPAPPPPAAPGSYFGSNYEDPSWQSEGDRFRHRFNAAFLQFEVPVTEVQTNEAMNWTVTLEAAQIFLEPIFADTQEGQGSHFPFLSLPSELRIRIYEMLFAFPPAGICFWRTYSGAMEMRTVSKDLQDVKARDLWFTDWNGLRRFDPVQTGNGIACRPPSQLLSPLLVCSLMHKEAMPIFFDMNTFVFPDMEQMFQFLRPIGKERRAYIRHILLDVYTDHFRYPLPSQPHDEIAVQTERARLLNDCKRLTEIDIYSPRDLTQKKKKKKYDGGIRRTDLEIREIHRFIEAFVSLNRCHIRFGDDCPTPFETKLAQYEEQVRIGRDMICA